MNIMKKYIQPSAEIVNYTLEGTIAMSLNNKVDTNAENQFSNIREDEDWDDEF